MILQKIFKSTKHTDKNHLTNNVTKTTDLVGFEPTIPCLGGMCIIQAMLQVFIF